MADHEAVNEQLKKDNEDLRKQLGKMGAQLERLTTLLLEQRTNTTAGPSAIPLPEQQQTQQGHYDPYGIPQQQVQPLNALPLVTMPYQIPPAPQGNQAVPPANTQIPHSHHEEHDSAHFDYQQT